MSEQSKYLPSSDLIKVTQALGFLLSLDDNHKMNRVKLMKILWAADRLHMRRYGRTVTGMEYFALPHGPVCSLALDVAQLNSDKLTADDISYIGEFFTKDGSDTAMNKKPPEDFLSDSDKAALTDAWGLFGSQATFSLADDISHQYPEWSKFEDSFRQSRSCKLIDIQDFFENPEDDKYFNEDPTQLAAAREAYDEQKNIQRELSDIFGA